VTYSQKGEFFVVAGNPFCPQLFDEETFKKVADLSGDNTGKSEHQNRVFSLKFNPYNPNMLVSGGWDNCVYIYDVR